MLMTASYLHRIFGDVRADSSSSLWTMGHVRQELAFVNLRYFVVGVVEAALGTEWGIRPYGT